MTHRWVGFLTDYGYRDGFVAACHGVIARIAPDVRVIDVTHAVPAQDVRHGAVVLAQTVPYLPPGVVVGVVDPGVGSARRGIALTAGEYTFVGPDNGLLGWAADAVGGAASVVELASPEYRLSSRAATFHGRDVFAPAAAHIAAGVPVSELGPAVPVDTVIRLPDPLSRVRDGVVETEAHLIDHFGNVTLAARGDVLMTAGISAGDRVQVSAGASGSDTGDEAADDVRVRRVDMVVGRIFADVGVGELVLYVDSHGYLAIAVNQDSAAGELRLHPGDPVTVRRASSSS
ncbi:SAM-dependent chlorinase/fluorinase [Phytoactinopolyspora alkaliphila]|uniref:SAM-dependent chlorinase/fluorinase n=1 Tax=Phytoactinopolyspora alkaliphila TaxID=1783498 RepID=A0A6N9YMQ0_9ACTN|nr:SAM-dependent chlorinase/fluorinase [Phytoactinopolyspora alkaliphila]NED96138.1 SAM-dependent chlorinase/fluorinase [Phytoactinopolyspora alkaliphila]